MKPKVFVTRELPEESMRALRIACGVDVNPHDRILTKEELIENIKDKDGIITTISDRIDEEVIESAYKLRVISNCAVGVDNINIDAASRKFIAVTNTPGASHESVADHAFALLLAASRRVCEADAAIKKGEHRPGDPYRFLGEDIHGKTLGIIGFGRIGQAIARRGSGFGMNIIYNDIRRYSDEEKALEVEFSGLDSLLEESDFIIISTPLTSSTHHMIGMREFNKMKRSAVFINIGRGLVVDEKALVHALKHNLIRAAGLDVLENEPELTPGLRRLDNVVITPHIGSCTKDTKNAMADIAVSNLLTVLEGEKPISQVNESDVEIGLGFKHPFRMANGRLLKTREELFEALKDAESHHHDHHVTHDRNDFSTWSRDILKDVDLADKMQNNMSKDDTVRTLEKHLRPPKKKTRKSRKTKSKKSSGKSKKKSAKTRKTKKKATSKKSSKKTSKKKSSSKSKSSKSKKTATKKTSKKTSKKSKKKSPSKTSKK